eukprot:942758-Rhodomonas_salina.2
MMPEGDKLRREDSGRESRTESGPKASIRNFRKEGSDDQIPVETSRSIDSAGSKSMPEFLAVGGRKASAALRRLSLTRNTSAFGGLGVTAAREAVRSDNVHVSMLIPTYAVNSIGSRWPTAESALDLVGAGQPSAEHACWQREVSSTPLRAYPHDHDDASLLLHRV